MTQRLAEFTQRTQLANAALKAMRRRQHGPVLPVTQASDAPQGLVDGFNERAETQLAKWRTHEHGGESPMPVGAEERAWLLTRGDALLPAVQWTLRASNPCAATQAQYVSHLVSVLFINTAEEDEPYHEYSIVTRLACTDEHKLRIAYHKGTLSRTKYTKQFRRE